jgi:hypothetical protein
MNNLHALRRTLLVAAPLLILSVIALPAHGADGLLPLRSIPAEKQAFLDRVGTEIGGARAIVDPKAKALDPAIPAADPPGGNVYLDPHFAVGSGMVVAVTDQPPGDSSIDVVNLWARSDPSLIVYAGADSTDAKTGVVIISHGPETQSTRLSVRGHGALHVSGGDDLVLLLDAQDGLRFKLDLVAEVLG